MAETTSLVQPNAEEEKLSSQKKQSVELASAKLITILWKRESGGLDVERASVYGSSLLLPQVARSAGWPWELRFLVIRSYSILWLAILLQGVLVYMLNKEEVVMDKFAGQMYLCDLGRNMAECPDGPGCVGPGGTRYTPSRLYDWNSFITRQYVKESLKRMFPHKADDIDEKVDPGEFGVESHFCRLVGCFLFVTSLVSELVAIWKLLQLLIKLPTGQMSWIKYEPPLQGSMDKAEAKRLMGTDELGCVKIRVNGMPLGWKVFNLLVLWLPKALVWLCTLIGGTSFLMETAGIDDIVVNSTALTFILAIDEMLFDSLTTNATRSMVENVEAYEVVDLDEDEYYTDEQAMEVFNKNRKASMFEWAIGVVPSRLVLTALTTFLSVSWYYYDNCQMAEDGTWVSKSMYLPLDSSFSISQAFLPMLFAPAAESEPYWTMPKISE